MATNTSRKLLLISLASVVLTAILAVLSSLFPKWALGSFGDDKTLLIAIAVTVAALLILTYLQDKFSRPVAMSRPKNLAPDLTAFLESIKTRYLGRYEGKLGGRFEITLEAEELNDRDSKAITELGSQTKGPAADVIRQLFDQKGRLLLVGDPGAGKTGLLLKLAIELLEEIKDPNNEAFPLIFNLAGWSQYMDFGDWIKAMLVTDYDLSEAFAKKLLEKQRIIFFLDGLDELGHNEWWDRDELWARAQKSAAGIGKLGEDPITIRAACFRSLNDYLRDDRKAVICCRTEEYRLLKQRNQDAPVPAKVRVLSLTNSQISKALTDAAKHRSIKHHAAAINLLTMLKKPAGHDFFETLKTPFYFTLALEIFDREIMTPEDLPEEDEEINSYLLHRFVRSRLNTHKRTSGSDKSTIWLGWLAHFMRRKHFVTFQLRDLDLSSLADKMDRWCFDFWSKAITAVLFFIVGFFIGGWIYGLVFGVLGALFGSAEGFDEVTLSSNFDLSNLIRPWYWAALLNASWRAVLAVLPVFLLSLFVIIVKLSGKYQALACRTVLFILTCFVFAQLYFGALLLLCPLKPVAYYKQPYQKMLTDFRSDLIFSSVFFFGLSIFAFLLNRMLPLKYSVIEKVVSILIIILPLCFVTQTRLFIHSIVRLCLCLSGHMPVRYVTFLDRMANLKILEKDGAQWRFRHQNLQDYFDGSMKILSRRD